MNYTKREWKVITYGESTLRLTGKYYIGTKDYVLAEVDSEANAHLIAASPDMYEALKALQEHMTMGKSELGRPYLADVGRMARKALARAEGKV